MLENIPEVLFTLVDILCLLTLSWNCHCPLLGLFKSQSSSEETGRPLCLRSEPPTCNSVVLAEWNIVGSVITIEWPKMCVGSKSRKLGERYKTSSQNLVRPKEKNSGFRLHRETFFDWFTDFSRKSSKVKEVKAHLCFLYLLKEMHPTM